ncbi:MAG TPA: GntR family transcriptional regulator [Acidimicrobiales bacterium]|nr:GntR family transcriptional regulator [Acidimicrobiales bacterium]
MTSAEGKHTESSGPRRRPAGRTIRYREIADELRRRVEAGDYVAGRLLPSEADLSARYRASRVTIRRALEALRSEGLVRSRQGFGWFVPADLLRQSLGRLGTIEAQLEESGIASTRRIIGFAFVPAPPRARQILGVDTVLEVRRLNLANGEPFARVTVWCPDALGARLSRAEVEASPLYELIDVPLGGATQTIGAAAADPADAALLGLPTGSPVLVCERVTRAASGEAVLLSEHVFPGHLTEFSVDLPFVEASMAPSGLRLVE